MGALERIIGALTDAGSEPKQSAETPGSWHARCPSHDDHGPSLSVRGIEGQALVYCHAGCDTSAVLDELALSYKDLYDEPTGTSYAYGDGRVVHRSPDKKFRQSSAPKGKGQLYRLEHVRAAVAAGSTIHLCEGEKDVHALESVGAVATTSPMGASSWGKVDPTPLAGAQVVIVADKEEPGCKYAAAARVTLLELGCTVDVVHAMVGKDAADHVAAGHGVAELVPVDLPRRGGARRLRVTRGSQVTTKRVLWVMQDWIPTGSLTLLAGREGLGKSTIAAAIGAPITRGTLAGELHGTARNVLYVHTEDSREFTVAPRLKAAGADMERVLFVDVETDVSDSGTLVLPLDTYMLEELIVQHDVALVILDAATSSMSVDLSGKDDRAVRQYLEPLAQLAARRNCVVLGICHFGKRDGADTGKLILGSIAWSQVARSVLSVAQDEDSGHLVVTNTKGNFAPRTLSMNATIVSTTVPTDDGAAEVGVIEWLGESDRDARELLSGPEDDDAEDRTAAEAWLQDYLTEHGNPPAKQVKADAAKERIAERTLKRAAKKLKVLYSTEGFPRTSRWALPEQSGQPGPTEDDTLTHGPTGPTGPTGLDLQKHGGPTDTKSQSGQWGHGRVRDPTGPEVGVKIATPAVIRLCPECDEPLPAGKVRHPECFRQMEAQRLIDAAAPSRPCPECGDPVTGNTVMHVHCAAESARRKTAGAAA